jgi:hypothetical protein
VEPVLHADTYDYRSGKSAIEAVRTARERWWRYDWVLDVNIQGFLVRGDNQDERACCPPSQKKAPRGRRRPYPLADVWDRLAGKRLSMPWPASTFST